MSSRFISISAAASAFLMASTALAQTSGRLLPIPAAWSVGVSAGAAVPSNNLSSTTNTGFDISYYLGYRAKASPVEWRAEGLYEYMALTNNTSEHNRVAGGGLSLAWNLPSTASPFYLIAGPGYYTIWQGAALNSVNGFGVNGGAGLQWGFGGLGAYVEVRYYDIMTSGTSRSVLPITFGLRF